MTILPRTLLLTLWPPDARYKVLYKNVARLPTDRIFCCTLQAPRTRTEFPFEHKAFEPRQLHWRLTNTWPDFIYRHHFQSRRIASRIAQWASPFRPEVIWVLPELGAASVGYHLTKILNVPLHLTIHDAHETARFIVSPFYYPVYARAVRRLLGVASSVDAISDGMRDDLQRHHKHMTNGNTIVVPPCILESNITTAGAVTPFDSASSTRRIVLCGSMRVTQEEWASFLKLLSGLSFPVEIIAYAYPDLFHEVPVPRGVSIKHLPFAETEAGLIADFHANRAHACYLGLYGDPARELFARTSLSAKLTSYAAAGLPIIVHGPEDSAAWKLVETFRAGVRVLDGGRAEEEKLGMMLTDLEQWQTMANGAANLCRERFDLDKCMVNFKELLCQTAGR